MSDIQKDQNSGMEFIAVGETQNPKHVLVLLHGSGDNCRGMEPVGHLFAKSLPGTLVLVPNGSVPFSAILTPKQIEATKEADPAFDPDQARNWTGKSQTVVQDQSSFLQAVKEMTAAPVAALNSLIDSQLEKHGLSDRDLAVYGFSGGGVMALYTAIRRADPCAVVISHSGYFMGIDDDDVLSRPEVLLMVGDKELDENHPMRQLHEESLEYLDEMGLTVGEYVCKDLGHDINQEAFTTACRLIAGSLDIIEPASAVPPPPRMG